MTDRRVRAFGLIFIAALLSAGLAFDAPDPAGAKVIRRIRNASFEQGPDPGPQLWLPLGPCNPNEIRRAPSCELVGWSVTFGTVDYVGGLWEAPHGQRSIDLNGNGRGAIATRVPTRKLDVYRVVFSLAGNPGGPPIKRLRVRLGNGPFRQPQIYTFDTRDRSPADMGWERQTYEFVAHRTDHVIVFASLNGGFYGPAIDLVTWYQVETTATTRPPAFHARVARLHGAGGSAARLLKHPCDGPGSAGRPAPVGIDDTVVSGTPARRSWPQARSHERGKAILAPGSGRLCRTKRDASVSNLVASRSP